MPHSPLITSCLIPKIPPKMAVVDIDSMRAENGKDVVDKHSTFRSYCLSVWSASPLFGNLLKISNDSVSLGTRTRQGGR